MFAIINEKNERLSNGYTLKFVDASKRCCLWKNETPARNLLNKLTDDGVVGLRVEDIGDELPKVEKKERKLKEETQSQEEVEFDETSFFEQGINEKCLRCEGDCKQSALVKIIRCPSFKKIKK